MTTLSGLGQGPQLDIKEPPRALNTPGNTFSSPPSGHRKPQLPIDQSKSEAAIRANYFLSNLSHHALHPFVSVKSKMPVHLFLIQCLTPMCTTCIQTWCSFSLFPNPKCSPSVTQSHLLSSSVILSPFISWHSIIKIFPSSTEDEMQFPPQRQDMFL